MPGDVILRARGVVKHFGGIHAVDGMDLDITPGTITALIGPNGAGKSTFFNCLSGFYPVDSGTVTFQGDDVTRQPMHRLARRGLVRTFQLTRALERMTVLENMMLAPPNQPGEKLRGSLLWWRTRLDEKRIQAEADEVLEFFRLSHLADEYAGALSGGQKKLLDLARALMVRPTMMLLDEPMAGVNPTLGRQIMKRIEELRQDRDMTFLIVEHDMETVFGYCDPVIVMAEGRKLAEGSPDAVRNNPAVQEAYLGG